MRSIEWPPLCFPPVNLWSLPHQLSAHDVRIHRRMHMVKNAREQLTKLVKAEQSNSYTDHIDYPINTV